MTQDAKFDSDSPVTEPSLKRRFAYKLLGNLAALTLGLVALAIVPRTLGPADYGRFEFLSANFKLFLDTLTLQVPVAYFNWISRKGHKENTDYASGITLYFSLVAVILCALFIYAALSLDINNWIWPDASPASLWLALALAALVFVFQLQTYLADGRALTIGLEKIRLAQNLVKALGILALFYFGALTLQHYFLIQIVLMVGIVCITAVWLSSRGACSAKALTVWGGAREDREAFRRHATAFARPLMISMLIGFAVMYFDRWFLQLIGGATQQGYFSLSDRMGILVILFTSAMTPLLSREFAYAHEQGNHERMVTLFEHIKKFFFLAAVIGCFISAQSGAIVQIVGGEAFAGAVLPLAIMSLAPIHQTFGQLSGSLLIATHQTRLFAKISVALMAVSPLVAFLLLAPASWPVPGLQLGAAGLATKTLLMYAIGTNIQLYFNTKFLGVPYRGWLIYQIEVIGLVYLAATLARYIAALFTTGYEVLSKEFGLNLALTVNIAALGVSGAVFVTLIGLTIWARPGLIGVKPGDWLQLFKIRS